MMPAREPEDDPDAFTAGETRIDLLQGSATRVDDVFAAVTRIDLPSPPNPLPIPEQTRERPVPSAHDRETVEREVQPEDFDEPTLAPKTSASTAPLGGEATVLRPLPAPAKRIEEQETPLRVETPIASEEPTIAPRSAPEEVTVAPRMEKTPVVTAPRARRVLPVRTIAMGIGCAIVCAVMLVWSFTGEEETAPAPARIEAGHALFPIEDVAPEREEPMLSPAPPLREAAALAASGRWQEASRAYAALAEETHRPELAAMARVLREKARGRNGR